MNHGKNEGPSKVLVVLGIELASVNQAERLPSGEAVIELYMNSSQRGRYINTTTRYSVVEVASAQEKSADLFLPVSSAASITITEPQNELLEDDEFVGNIIDSGESDGDSGSDSFSKEESDML